DFTLHSTLCTPHWSEPRYLGCYEENGFLRHALRLPALAVRFLGQQFSRMKITTNENFAVVVVIAVAAIAFVALTRKSRLGSLPAVAPFIVADTVTDSPGTNLATRLVKFTADLGGTAPIFKQWKVNKGGGFVDVSASATNATLW